MRQITIHVYKNALQLVEFDKNQRYVQSFMLDIYDAKKALLEIKQYFASHAILLNRSSIQYEVVNSIYEKYPTK